MRLDCGSLLPLLPVPAFTTMGFRDALGVRRKYAVPLLDYLDATRFTTRDGHNRTPGAEARKLMGGAG